MTGKQESEGQGHLRDYWRVIRQGKWLILTVAVVVLTLVAVATFLQTPVYRATAFVEIQPRPKSISPAADFSQIGVTSWSWAGEERYLNTQMEIVRSREIAARVIRDEGLESNPQFASVDDPAALLSSLIRLEVVLDTYVLQISVENTDPSMAQLLASGVARAYINSNVESAVENTHRVIEGLYDQIEPIKSSIAEKEQRRTELSRRAAFQVPEAQEASMDNRLRQLQEELTEVQIRLGEREAIFNAIEEIERRGDSYDSIPQVASDPTIRDLREQAFTLEQQIEELSSSYRAGHPKLVAAAAALADIPGKIQTETEKIITRIKTEYMIDNRREADLLKQLRATREEGLGLSEIVGEIAILDADIKEDRRIYELITSRIREIGLNQETLINNVRLMQDATVPHSPVRPRKALNLAAGLLVGLFLGVGTVFFIDYLDNTIKSSEDVERFLNLPLLAMVPRFRNEITSSVKEAFQTLRTSILFASKGRTLKTVLVTSAGPGEGKSGTAVHLAKTLAAAGDRVILIDCDLRRPTVHARLGLQREGGLTNYLVNAEGSDSWSQYVKAAPDAENLSVLTCGPLPPNPIELFGGERFLDLLKQLREDFSWVLIDSPPLASLSDSVVLASMIEMTVLVIKHNENDRDLIRSTTQQLRKVDANVVGAVLNAVDLKRVGYHDYHYAGYEYHGEESSERRKPSRKKAAAAAAQRRS
jgi:capsular exopolysaccharide synthesis family protein